MKKFLVIACASLLGIGCNTETTSSEKNGSTTDSTGQIEYAYLPANHPPDYWIHGDQKSVAMVLNTLKAFETGDIEGSLAGFADSVRWATDGFDAKISRDSLRTMFTEWKKMSTVKIEMEDYEGVISKDKKEEWVTLWYKQINTNKEGISDSLSLVNDLKIENGKITVLDEKARRYPVKK